MKEIDKLDQPRVGIGSDIPQTDPALDSFGYASVAKLIADAVVKTPSPQGLVMAIHGQWGMGKSSLLNFVKYYLTENQLDPQPVVVDFNPWWFDDQRQLANQFLSQFKAKLNPENKALRDVGDLMAEYSGALGKAVSVSTGIPWIDVPVGFLLKCLKRKPQDVPKLKAEIASALDKNNQRFIVVVDDIDRLSPAEIREVFKVVKALADFPNVVYLLSFDRDVVARALTNAMQVDGESYLEKIVQVPYVLPAVDGLLLRNKLFKDLDRLLEGADATLFDSTYWGNVFMEGMAPMLTKPRDIVRFVNMLSVTFPALRDEVNIADFFALEFLRLKLPKLYDTIRENRDRFSGYAQRGIQSQERTEDRTFHESWANDLDGSIREGIQAMMERIFPKLSNMGRGSEFLSEWARVRRAAHPDVFPIYFQFAIDQDQLSRQAISDFIQNLSNANASENTLLDAIDVKRHDGSSKAKEYLSRLLDFDCEIDAARATTLLNILGRVGDKFIIPGDETGGMFAPRSTWLLIWVMQHALNRLPANRRDDQLITSFRQGRALTYLWAVILSIETCHEKPVDHGAATVLTQIKPETLAILQDIALARIDECAEADLLIEVPELPSVLARWRDRGAPDAARVWADKFASDTQNLLRLMATFLSEQKSQAFGDRVGRVRRTLNLKLMSDFINLEKAEALLSNSVVVNRGSDLVAVVETFKKQLPVFRQGKDPDSPFAMTME
jgi:predicted KAP-like P-loop ATPase